MAATAGDGHSPSPALSRYLPHPVLLALGFGLLTALLMTLSTQVMMDQVTRSAVWWPEAGVAVALFTRITPRQRISFAAALFAALATVNVLAGYGVGGAVAMALAGSVQALVIAEVLDRLLARTTPDHRGLALTLRGPGDVARLTAATGIGVLTGSFVVTGYLLAVDQAAVTDQLGDLLLAAHRYGMGQLTGILVLAPALLALQPHAVLVRGRRLEWVAQSLVTIGITTAAFYPTWDLPITFLVIVPLLWSAARLGLLRTAFGLVVTTTIVAVGTARGGGPFAGLDDPALATTMAQGLVVVQALSALALALTAERRDEALATLRSREESYRRTFDRALLGMALIKLTDTGAVLERANHALGEILGPGLVGRRWSDLIADEDRATVTSATLALRDGAMTGWRGELRHEIGKGYRWLEVALAPLPEDDGTVLRLSAQVVDVTERRLAEDQLRDMALHDSLTGLPNRTLMMDRLDLALAGVARTGGRVALLYCDLDDFKNVNDTVGHALGDRMLIEITNRLVGAIRPTDTVARLGGDEFAVLCPDVPDSESAEAIALRVLSALSDPVTVDDASYTPGGSIGITLSRPDSTADSILREADTAMYQAKRSGKRQLAVFTHEQHTSALRTVQLESQLLQAVEHEQFRLFFQPVMDLSTGRVVAMEALVRWQHPERGLLAPGEWLDIAEQTPVIHAMGQWVLEEACRTAVSWSRLHGPQAPIMHVNVSPRQLQTGTFPDEVRAVLERFGLPGSQLVLELTETELDRVRDSLRVDVQRLRADGIRLAADDFGTGYSPLTRLTELPVDMIKIDRRFVADMHTDERSMAVVQAVVGLGQALGLQVVAEGVETRTQAESLRRLGCLSAQGFLWSPPQAAETAQKLITAPPARIPAPRERSEAASPARPAPEPGDLSTARPAPVEPGQGVSP
jgi:diguanylate cyclase (GGDEF)-like protein/PAS domain S-box-containing protein